jgi:SAM-dependent methyltransferase
MRSYYTEKLHSNNLMCCYDLAPPRIQQYLAAEISFVQAHIGSGTRVLELGCGYGRVLQHLLPAVEFACGIDISQANIALARQLLSGKANCFLSIMDAVDMGFRDSSFDCIVCIQNGISAFHADQRMLISESIRVTRDKGLVLFSSYSEKIWSERLAWFGLQSDLGLIGEIDWQKTYDGVIVCKDGFSATTVDPETFRMLLGNSPVYLSVQEVDESSIFYVMTVHKHAQV